MGLGDYENSSGSGESEVTKNQEFFIKRINTGEPQVRKEGLFGHTESE